VTDVAYGGSYVSSNAYHGNPVYVLNSRAIFHIKLAQ